MAADLTDGEIEGASDNGRAHRVGSSTESQSPINESSLPEDGAKDEDNDQDDEEENEDDDDANDDEDDEDDDDEDEDDDDSEPTLKYAKLTPSLSRIYRNGDSTSASVASADKLIIGTHGGNIHILSIPSLKLVRSYRAHSSSITGISVSPYSPAFSSPASEPALKPGATPQFKPNAQLAQPSADSNATPKNSTMRQSLQSTLSNSVYIASSSIDGHVCVSSLVDAKDVTLRNYARPVHAVALSPSFKADRTYLSGGVAGNLILTIGGKAGESAVANTNSAAAAASGWLGTIGIGSNTGKDSIIHGGEGIITSIKWSLSGKYVVWNNEWGTRIMRSHLHLKPSESDLAWKRIGHVSRPNTRIWEEMAGVWKARVEWIDEISLESSSNDEDKAESSAGRMSSDKDRKSLSPARKQHSSRLERLMVGWGDYVWILRVGPGASDSAPSGGLPAEAAITHKLFFSDCIVCGLALYTPSILIALVYHNTKTDSRNPNSATKGTPTRGKFRRKDGEPPELRLIDLSPQKDDSEAESHIARSFVELEAESLVVSRYDDLSAVDYSLSSLYVSPTAKPVTSQKGTLGALGDGFKDVSFNATRLFSSNASVLSGSSGEDKSTSSTDNVRVQSPPSEASKEGHKFLASPGLKIFVHSQFDCLVAVKRDRSDQLSWLLDHEQYEEAWNLLKSNPEIMPLTLHQDSRPTTPTRNGPSLAEFFDDETASVTTAGADKSHQFVIETEMQRIGSLWIQQLISQRQWSRAGQVAGMVLGDSPKWADWILTFAQAEKFDEITPYIPHSNLRRPLPSLVYEVILGHYINHDISQLQKLLDRWSPTLFDIPSIISTIKDRLKSDNAEHEALEDKVEGHDDRILLKALAKLNLADNNPSAAIRCYIRTRDADEALDLIHEYKMMKAVADDIFVFLRIRISPEQQNKYTLEELDDRSKEPIRLLVAAAVQDIIGTSTVVSQLRPLEPISRPYLFFYFRALWLGDMPEDSTTTDGTLIHPVHQKKSRFAAHEIISRAVISPHDNLVVSLFAEYSQPLLNEFLQKSGRRYDLQQATEECERRHLIPELVLLLKDTGQTSRALHLIIDELDDVSMAVAFAKEVDHESLWYDLLDHSMDKPAFIRELLEEVGTIIDPATLVRRIPEGMDIPDLKQSLLRLVEESKTSKGITESASNILNTEVASVLNTLRRNRERGLVFDASKGIGTSHYLVQGEAAKSQSQSGDKKRGECASCQIPFGGAISVSEPREDLERLIGFTCGHLFHLSCLLDKLANDSNGAEIRQLHRDLDRDNAESDSDLEYGRVGTKIRHAQMIQRVLGDLACYECNSPAPTTNDGTQND